MRKRIGILLLILLISTSFVACVKTPLITPDGEDYTNYTQTSYNSLEFFGTTTYLVLGGNFKNKAIKQQADDLWISIQKELRLLDNTINENIESSDIYKFNHAEAGTNLEISFYTFDLLSKCIEFYNISNKKFNPAVYHLIDLWGFTPRFTSANYKVEKPYDRDDFKSNLPDTKYIEAFNSLTNFDDIELSEIEGKYYIKKPNNEVIIDGEKYNMAMSLGGIGKGYATDVANKLIKEKFNFGYISIGGSSMAINKSIKQLGTNPLDWKVGIGHPRKDVDRYLNLYISDKSLSTSGDYERYYETGGKRYCHIINQDGYPIQTNIVTCSVVGDSSAMCDAISTAISCMSIEEAKAFMKNDFVKNNGLDIYFLFNNNDIYEFYANGEFEITDKDYKYMKE